MTALSGHLGDSGVKHADARTEDAPGTPALAAVAGGTDRLGQISWSRVAGRGQI